MSYSVYPAPSTGIQPSQLITEPSWTLINSSQGNASTVSFTGISGYRKLRIIIQGGFSSTTAVLDARFRVNGDTSQVYSYLNKQLAAGSGAEFNAGMAGNDTGFLNTQLFVSSTRDSGQRNFVAFEIDNANNSERIKTATVSNYYNQSGNAQLNTQFGYYRGNPAPITSLSIVTVDGTAIGNMTSPAGIYLYGAN